MYPYVSIGIHAYIYIHLHVYVYTCTYLYVYTCIQIRFYEGTYTHYGLRPFLIHIDPHAPSHKHIIFHTCIQRYIIPACEIRKVRLLGSGTFGEVILAEWLGTRVALKTQIEQQSSIEKKPDSEFQVCVCVSECITLQHK